MTPLEMLLIGFAVGLTGAMTPGPMLFATIESSLRAGWAAGPKIVLGHAVLEAFISILIIFGLSAVVSDNIIRTISFAGGLFLCIFGLFILRDIKKASLDIEHTSAVAGPVFAGIITSASNPYFWVWWLSAGNSLIMEGLKTGLIAAGIFVMGHWIADTVWYSFVSFSLSRGKKIMSDNIYRHILTACGLFLLIFGLWFIVRQFSPA
jgi:threonine/homoserine/homoserine lactone efflux protein